MAKKKGMNASSGAIILMICGLIAVALIIGCVFFPDQIFGIFQ